MKKILFFTFILFCFNSYCQILPSQYAIYESNRGKGNGKLYYKLYSVSTSSVFPESSVDYDTYLSTYGTYRSRGTFNVATNSGTINSSSSNSTNTINFYSSAEFLNSINNQSPYPEFDGNYFSVVVSGYFIPKQTGTYTFSVEGDDAVDLFINNVNVANHYGGHGASAIGTHTGNINLIAGKKYTLRARFQENAGGEVFTLFWKKPSESNGTVWFQDAEELSTNEILPNGLVYSFDPGNFYSYPKIDNANATYNDLYNNVSGTLLNNTTFSNDNSNVLIFDGDMDAVDFGSNIPNFPSSDISVFLWINATSLRNGWNIFFTKWFNSAISTSVSDFHYSINPNGGQYFQNLFTTNASNMFGSTPISTATWYHVGFTISNGNMQMYLNGQPDGPQRNNVNRTNYINAKLLLGDPRTGGLVTFHGKIGTISIYNRGIDREEAFQNFNISKHRYGFTN